MPFPKESNIESKKKIASVPIIEDKVFRKKELPSLN